MEINQPIPNLDENTLQLENNLQIDYKQLTEEKGEGVARLVHTLEVYMNSDIGVLNTDTVTNTLTDLKNAEQDLFQIIKDITDHNRDLNPESVEKIYNIAENI